MFEQIYGNWVCWGILGLALICYYQLSISYIMSLGASEKAGVDIENLQIQQRTTGILIGALPLLGLLGTIIGLLDCFIGIASQGASNELVSAGIADALLTTQLGLVCAIPAWLIHAYVRSVHASFIPKELSR
ncbi:MotA/TolQ/ExbB proton channel family protein [Alteromonas sp. 1_MG-2023]|uniref:MotA/TolQ/ExbB proton channel family protein n=1 Tax=Alteromonas sp. 1_MG-2023 TaxID=3062669 RepID=UPI0026E3394E|nr:MotA/TolQ/ExbB proton channel family protein [Alteromonas sp. 1_MG-2023]MDO6567709.1 MotA/TolQ/ExbB proton channel family protein [Alteromonas sp. 1_MG-2023]